MRLDSLDGLDTRPTLDRVKEPLFSMIAGNLPGARVLDLFAGSGALGIEALSRGADEAVFVDASSKALAVVRANLIRAKAIARTERADYRAFLERETTPYDFIFLDPPYQLGAVEKALALITEHDLLTPDGVIAVEFDRNLPPEIQGFSVLRERYYGRVGVLILEQMKGMADSE